MSWDQVIGLVLTVAVMGVGVIGCMFPGVPGTPVVMLAALGHRLYFGTHGAATWVLWALGVLTVTSVVMDYVATYLGARRMGASCKGILGAFVGGVIGIFFGLPGLLLGPLLGALTFEVLSGRRLRDSFRAGVGATLGLIAGSIGRLACCLKMIAGSR